MNIKDWLNQEPDESEVRMRDGAKYIPIHIIKQKLNYLCNEHGGYWNRKNVQHVYHNFNMLSAKGKTMHKTIVSATVEIEVVYFEPDFMRNDNGSTTTLGYKEVRRVLAGGANFLVNGSHNPHTTATAISLATLNAVKDLGAAFGYGLNGFETYDEEVPEPVTEVKEEVVLSQLEQTIVKLIETSDTIDSLKLFESKVNDNTRPYFDLQLLKLKNTQQ